MAGDGDGFDGGGNGGDGHVDVSFLLSIHPLSVLLILTSSLFFHFPVIMRHDEKNGNTFKFKGNLTCFGLPSSLLPDIVLLVVRDDYIRIHCNSHSISSFLSPYPSIPLIYKPV